MQLTTLELQWQSLFLPFAVQPTLSKRVFSSLVTAYSGEGRHYHNLVHIHKVLKIVNELEPLAHNSSAIQMAAWFHDVIYDTKSSENEEKSAEFASSSLSQLGIPTIIINKVVKMILNTHNHQAVPKDLDSHILLDADLSILGSAESEYMAYAQAIRQEYSWVPNSEYKIARKRILRNFLEQDRIYFTDIIFNLLEVKSRENISNEISQF